MDRRPQRPPIPVLTSGGRRAGHPSTDPAERAVSGRPGTQGRRMASRRARRPSPDPSADVRISDPGRSPPRCRPCSGLRPRESVVLSVSAAARRVGLTVRGDSRRLREKPSRGGRARPHRAHRRAGRGAAGGGLRGADVPERGRAGPGTAARAGLPHRGVVHQLVVALAEDGVPVREALLVARRPLVVLRLSACVLRAGRRNSAARRSVGAGGGLRGDGCGDRAGPERPGRPDHRAGRLRRGSDGRRLRSGGGRVLGPGPRGRGSTRWRRSRGRR